MPIAKLDRAVLKISGPDAETWLEGLITNNLISDLTFAALLTPQGKIIADFFVHRRGEGFLLETARKFEDGLLKRLKMYKLRAEVEIVETNEAVYAAFNETELSPNWLIDPRHPNLGYRRISGGLFDSPEEPDAYDLHRLGLGVPDSHWDFDTAEMFPADVNMDLLCGVDFSKGCFVGQEVVSRMKRRTEVRKRVCGIELSAPLEGVKIEAGGRQIGDILHTQGLLGIALVRLDRWGSSGGEASVGGVAVSIKEVVGGNPQK